MAERVSYLGLTLSDSHSTQVEMILTNFVVTLMQTEGSTFYRSDTVAQGKQQEQVTKGSKRKNENSKEERPKAKAKGKSRPKTTTKLRRLTQETTTTLRTVRTHFRGR